MFLQCNNPTTDFTVTVSHRAAGARPVMTHHDYTAVKESHQKALRRRRRRWLGHWSVPCP